MMEDSSDFFGSVFDDPEDDPLLGGESSESEGTASDADQGADPRENGVPSWMSDDEPEDEERTAGDSDPKRKEIVVVQRGESQQGLDELNEAVGQGWRLVKLSLAGDRAVSREGAQRFVAVLKQESPQSLFDFTGP